MSFTQWLDAHRRSVLFLFLVLTLGGLVAAWKLPAGLFPRTTFPRVVVSVDAGDRPADRMVVEVTRPLEEVIRAVQGVRDVRSNSSRGSCDISVNFDWGTDMIAATLMVQSAVARVLPTLPAATTYQVRRMDPTVFPVLGLSLRSSSRSLVDLRDRALFDLRPRLSTVRGVASVAVAGGQNAEVQVLVSPEKLAASGVTLEDVEHAVSAANVVQAIGKLEEDEKLYLILSDTQFSSLDELGRVIVQRTDKGVVTLEDVATIKRSVEPNWTRVVADGDDAVLVNIYQQPDGNTVQIEQDIRNQLDEFRRDSPSDLKLDVWYDQSELVSDAMRSVRDAALVGVLLAIGVLWLFLRSFRVTIVASACVVVALAITCLVLYVFGQGLDIMTLGGMAAAVGLVLDDGIVMVEHGVRRLREGNLERRHVVLQAARELSGALTGSSLVTVAVFVPLSFLSGVTGAFFRALALAMASALVVSYAFALLAVPLLSDQLLHERDARADDEGRVLGWVVTAYRKLLTRLLARPSLVLLGAVPVLALGVVSYLQVGTGFMPAMDEGGFILDYRAPPGTSLSETDRRLKQVEEILAHTPEVRAYSRRTGLALGGGITEANEGDYFIRLKTGARRPISEVMDEVRARIESRVPGLEIEFAQLMEDLIGDLTAVPQPVEIKLFGAEPPVLRARANDVAKQISGIEGIVDVKSGVVLAGDALDIRVNRAKAKRLGLDPDSITRLARVALEGAVTTAVQEKEKMVGIRVWGQKSARASVERIGNLTLLASDGTRVRLGRVATFEKQVGQPQITRENLKTMVSVTGRISGRDLGSVMRDVKSKVGSSQPGGIYVTYGGLYQQQQESFRALVLVMVAAALLVFAVLLFMFERFSAPTAILVVSLLAASGVFPALWWSSIELNITSMVGLTMIVGISGEAAVFYMSQWQESARELSGAEALVDAGARRLRPIAMTAIAAILALLPLALGIGRGSAMLQPLAIAIIAGLVLTVPAVLLVLPVLMHLVSRRNS